MCLHIPGQNPGRDMQKVHITLKLIEDVCDDILLLVAVDIIGLPPPSQECISTIKSAYTVRIRSDSLWQLNIGQLITTQSDLVDKLQCLFLHDLKVSATVLGIKMHGSIPTAFCQLLLYTFHALHHGGFDELAYICLGREVDESCQTFFPLITAEARL